MNRNLNIFLWIVFFTLMAPSGMALASWNAVPGDNTYGIKLAMEKALLLVISPSSQLQSTTNFKLTERRMGEATKVLSGVHAKESLDNLTMQIEATRKSLNGITDEQAKKEAIAQYIQTLHEVTSQLEEQKVNRAISYLPPQRKTTTSYKIVNPKQTTTQPTTTTPTSTQPVINNVTNNYYYQKPPSNGGTTTTPTTTQPIVTQPSTPATTTPVTTQPNPTPEEIIQPEVVEDINNTQDEIDQVIEELEQEAENIPDVESETESATENTNEQQQPNFEAPNQVQQLQQQNENSGENNGRGQNENSGQTQEQENQNGNQETNTGE